MTEPVVAPAHLERPLAATENLVLVGPRGTGKTTYGRELAKRLERHFIDTDALIARRAGRDVDTFLEEAGEASFREVEAAALREAAANRGAVVATGGGAVLCRDAFAELAATGIVAWLVAPEAWLRRRARDRPRPPLTGLPPEEEAVELAASREPLYRAAAQLIVRVDLPDPILAALSALGVVGGPGAV